MAGTRHCSDIKLCRNLIHIDDRLLFEMDDTNPYDEHAIKVIFHKDGKNYHLGYVPRYYSKYLTDVLNDCISYSAMIEKVRIDPVLKEDNITVFVKLIFNK